MNPPVIVWIMGVPSAGKSTLAGELRRRLLNSRRSCLLLDGDELRGGLCRGLGFSIEDRTENLRRAAEVAALSARCGVSSVAAMITPLRSQRVLIAEILAGFPMLWVWADCPVAECRRRDVKCLYRRQQAGDLVGLTGADLEFEQPDPDVLRISTHTEPVEICVDKIIQTLELTRHSSEVPPAESS
jgi:adenylylsulfate kinase